MTTEQCIRASFFEQAEYCDRLGSTFMRDLLIGLGKQLDASSATGKRILEWPGDPEPKSDALALRLAGALHALARSGVDQDLAAFYREPSRSGEATFIPTVLSAVSAHDQVLLSWLDFAPQTNEVARASIIYAGLCVIADRFKLPLALHEMGCSGGLNLQCAAFGYRFQGKRFGSVSSQLQLEPDWNGGLPPEADIKIASRLGCDLNPLSAINSEDAAKLVAYLWPDQPARIARIEAAIKIAMADPPLLEQAGALQWVKHNFQADNGDGTVRVLYNTIAWNYFPASVKDEISKHMEAVGAKASRESPLAWLTFEFDEADNGPFLKLHTWPGNGETEVLAAADPHVYGVNWLQE